MSAMSSEEKAQLMTERLAKVTAKARLKNIDLIAVKAIAKKRIMRLLEGLPPHADKAAIKISDMKTADEVLAEELKDPEFAKEWERERGAERDSEGHTR